MNPRLRIATRGSHLALAQSRYIQSRIAATPNAPQTELVIIKTSGDANQVLSLAEAAGGDARKGLFTKEIEDALLGDHADIAVHSFKDLPTQMVEGLRICAVPQRIESLDILVFPKVKKAYDRLPYVREGSTIGTSSARRVAQLKYLFPEIKPVLLRGNVPTRMRRLLAPDGPDATLLSAAGIERLSREGFFDGKDPDSVDLSLFEIIPIPASIMVPAPAQGTLAIQCRITDSRAIAATSHLHDEELARIIAGEREILARLEGGCHLPLGTHMTRERQKGKTYFQMHMFLGEEAIQNRRKKSYQVTRCADTPERLSKAMLEDVLYSHAIVVTGRPARCAELKQKFPHIHSLPLIDTQILPLPRDLEPSIRKEGGLVAAFFSESGVAAASSIRALREDNVQFAAVSHRTAEAVKNTFGRSAIVGTATGKDLAHAVIEKTYGPVFAFRSQDGREDFMEVLGAAGRPYRDVPLYKTTHLPVDRSQLESLPSRAAVIFASPSAFLSWIKAAGGGSSASAYHLERGLRLCAIGNTTADAMLEMNCVPYAISEHPDLDAFIQELMQ